MIRSITRQKPLDEIMESLDGHQQLFIFGCGTCVTLCRTGGVEEVQEMARELGQRGIFVTGSTVIPVACDEISREAVDLHAEEIAQAQAALIMTCAFGVQTLSRRLSIPVIPAVDTLFIGKEKAVGLFEEICTQCGECVLGDTGGLCPVTNCHKGLVNGPCGGTNNGKCEIDPQKDCVWSLIYQRLSEQGRLDRMKRLQPPRNHQVSPKPAIFTVPQGQRR